MNKPASLNFLEDPYAALACDLGVLTVPIQAVGLEIFKELDELYVADPIASAEEQPAPDEQGRCSCYN